MNRCADCHFFTKWEMDLEKARNAGRGRAEDGEEIKLVTKEERNRLAKDGIFNSKGGPRCTM